MPFQMVLALGLVLVLLYINHCWLFNAESGLYNRYMICKHKSTKLNSSKYSNVSLTIQHQSFVYTQLNDQTVLFQTIQFCISY